MAIVFLLIEGYIIYSRYKTAFAQKGGVKLAQFWGFVWCSYLLPSHASFSRTFQKHTCSLKILICPSVIVDACSSLPQQRSGQNFLLKTYLISCHQRNKSSLSVAFHRYRFPDTTGASSHLEIAKRTINSMFTNKHVGRCWMTLTMIRYTFK